jgi:hypothetical protein
LVTAALEITERKMMALKMTTEIPESITTPDSVETSIGTLEFADGVPSDATVETVYDYIDRSRAVNVFLNNLGAASIHGLGRGNVELGADTSHKIPITEQLLDSKSLFLTANTSTLYAIPFLDLKAHGPTVIEIPSGMLAALNDAWFRYVGDFGPAGQDKGTGGKYVILPPDHRGDLPDGYFVLQSPTYCNWVFLRGNISDGLKKAVGHIKSGLRIYPLASADEPPTTEFIDNSGTHYNTIAGNDMSFYDDLNEVVQHEPIEAIDPETRGLIASIGIVKGQAFAPDERMKKILADAVAIGNATARAILWSPRQKGAKLYPDSDSAWNIAFTDRNVFFEADGARNLDARAMFLYSYTAVTPAMAKPREGQGSDYGIAYRDSEQRPLEGARTYNLHLPPDVPVASFWAVTVYDAQTRSMLQTDQQFPTLGSQSDGFVQNSDGTYDLYFGPEAPEGKDANWLQTIPGKSWFCILRMYGPLKPWLDQTWRPGEIERQD